MRSAPRSPRSSSRDEAAVRPPRFRGSGLGKLLTLRLIDEARKRQYSCFRLDTVPSMQRAIALYRSLGFKLISPYRYNR
jgi:putative acetyltransferase